MMGVCPSCKQSFSKNSFRQVFCSNSCRGEATTKKKVPKEDLEKIIWTLPLDEVGKTFGVSGTTISLWCKAYDIPRPTKGYWSKRRTKSTPHPQ